MKRILWGSLLIFLLAACGTSSNPEVPQTTNTFKFSVDPAAQSVKFAAVPTGVFNAQAEDGSRVLVPGTDLSLESSTFTFLPGNVLAIDAVFKNVSDQTFTNLRFNRAAGSNGVVSSTEPGLVARLEPGASTGTLRFTVQHRGQPFTYAVEVSAIVGETGETKCTDPVNIPDDVLRKAIRRELQKPEGDITCADMASLTELKVDDDVEVTPVDSLEGIQFAVGLEKLFFFIPSKDVSSSYFEPLSVLTNLTELEMGNLRPDPEGGDSFDSNLDLEDVDFSFLARLSNLTLLRLPDTRVGDISFLNSLPKLVSLDLADNVITDYSPLSRLTTLNNLDLSSMRLGSNFTKISDIGFLRNVTSLTALDLSSNSISDITPLGGLTNLTVLFLGGNNITDLDPMAGLTNLEGLFLTGNSVNDIAPLSGLTNLTFLELSGNDVTDLSSVAGLTNLDDLYLESNYITDISPLVANTGLGNGDGLIILTRNCLDTTSGSQALSDIETIENRNPNAQNVDARFQREGEEAAECGQQPPPPPPAEDCTDPVTIPDDTLRQSVRDALNKPEGDITCADMQSLTELSVRGEAGGDGIPTEFVEDLEGLQYAVNLTSLVLPDNPVNAADLDLLRPLTKLKTLDLSGSRLEDAGPLSRLETLEVLKLSRTQVTDLLPLGRLTNLRVLELDQNKVDNEETYINDIRALSGLTDLRRLSINQGSVIPDQVVLIDDLEPLRSLTQLNELELSSNNITDITPLSGLTNLTLLNLGNEGATLDQGKVVPVDNSISDLGPLRTLTRLTKLNLFANQISDLSPLDSLVNLTNLNLGFNSVQDITPLQTLSGLSQLYIGNNFLTDIGSLVAIQGLGDSNDSINLSENCLDFPGSSFLEDVETIENRNPNRDNVFVGSQSGKRCATQGAGE